MNSRCNRKCFCFQNRYAFNIVSNGPTSIGFQNIEVKLNNIIARLLLTNSTEIKIYVNHFSIMSTKST